MGVPGAGGAGQRTYERARSAATRSPPVSQSAKPPRVSITSREFSSQRIWARLAPPCYDGGNQRAAILHWTEVLWHPHRSDGVVCRLQGR